MIVLQILCKYYCIKKIYNIYVSSNMERQEVTKLLNLVHEGILIISRDFNKKVLFCNRKFREYLNIQDDLQQYLSKQKEPDSYQSLIS